MPVTEMPNIKELQKNGDVSGLIAAMTYAATTYMEDRKIHLAAVEALGEIGEPAVPALIMAFENHMRNLGGAINKALVKIGTPAPSII